MIREYPANHRKRVNRSKKARRRFYDKAGKRCWYCGGKLKKKKFILEHQTPFSRGGSCQLKKNVVLSCEECDKEKAHRNVEEYRWFLIEKRGEYVVFFGEK